MPEAMQGQLHVGPIRQTACEAILQYFIPFGQVVKALEITKKIIQVCDHPWAPNTSILVPY